MSKAEDLSRQYVLPFLDKQYEKYGEYRQMGLSRFDGYDMMSAYEEGYHQAEKDLELTWEDISNISDCLSEVEEEITVGQHKGWGLKEMYQEALKRFKNLKHVK